MPQRNQSGTQGAYGETGLTGDNTWDTTAELENTTCDYFLANSKQFLKFSEFCIKIVEFLNFLQLSMIF